jgi:hypothetical protein
MKEYQNKCFINEFNIQIYSIILILISILMAFLTTKFHCCDSFIIEIMEDLTERQKNLPIPTFVQLFIWHFM